MRIIVNACIALASCALFAVPVPASADGHHHGGGNHGGYGGNHNAYNGGHGSGHWHAANNWGNHGSWSHQRRGDWNNGNNRWNGRNYANSNWNRHRNDWNNGNNRWNGRNYTGNDWGRRHYGNGRNVVIERNYYGNGGYFDSGYYRNDYPWRNDNGNNFASGLATGIIGAGIMGLMQNLNRPAPDVVYANEDRFPDPPQQNTAVEAPARANAKASTGPITIVVDGKGNATCKVDIDCPAGVKVITPPAQHDTVIIQTPNKSETTTVPQTTIIEKKAVVCTCETTLAGDYLYTCLGQQPVIVKACPKP